MNIKRTFILIIYTCIGLGLLSIPDYTIAQNQSKTGSVLIQSEIPPAVRPNSDTLAIIRRRGILRVGISLFVPWVIRRKDGNLIGYEIDMAKRLADDIGVEVEFVPVPFKEIINDLLDERFDIIISGLYVTPQRAIFVNFSEPAAKSEVTLLASQQAAGNFGQVDFNKPEVKIGAVEGTVYVDLAKDNFPKAKLKKFKEEEDMLNELLEGKLHAVVATSPVPEITASVHPDKVFLPLLSPIAQYGESFAIRKGDGDFLNYLNTWIKYYKESNWLSERRNYWFNGTEWADQL